MIKAIFFDFDGVIHDTLHIGYSINKMLLPDLTIEEYKKMFLGNFYEHKTIDSEMSRKFFELAEKDYLGLKIEENIKKEITELKNKFLLFIITSNKESIVGNYFKENNLHDLFAEILGFETHKSKVYKFESTIKKYGLKKEECVFITDTLGDIIEANSVGIKTIAVDFGFHDSETLKKGTPHAIISDLSNIENVIKNIY